MDRILIAAALLALIPAGARAEPPSNPFLCEDPFRPYFMKIEGDTLYSFAGTEELTSERSRRRNAYEIVIQDENGLIATKLLGGPWPILSTIGVNYETGYWVFSNVQINSVESSGDVLGICVFE